MVGIRCSDDAAPMRYDAGSSLIESLTALAVFAIGSACHSMWMMQSMATHARASRLIAATTIAVSLEMRMRANRGGVIDGDYVDDNVGNNRCSRPCDARARAADDLRSFRVQLSHRVGAAASGDVSCVAGPRCTISIAWLDREILAWNFRP